MPAPTASALATGSACHGSAGRAASADIAARDEKISATARFTGYQIDGGYAEFTVADQRFCFAIPERYDDVAAAPLLCAGLIGYRALRLAGDAERLGIYGFGAAAHIIAQVARHQGRRIFAFTRPGDGRRSVSPRPSARYGPAGPTARRRSRSTPR